MIWILRLVSTALLVQMACSPTLWWSDNNGFFTVPLASFFDWGNWFDQMLTLLIGVTLGVASFVEKYRRQLCLAAVGMVFLLISKDINRLQSWVFQYTVIIFVIGISREKQDKHQLINVLRWVLIFTYFWAGFHKLSPHYHENVHKWLMGIFEFTKRFKENTAMSYFEAFVELSIGFMLIFRMAWKLMPWFILFFHAVILLFLSVDGWNSVVWPWNLTMITLVFLLFYRAENSKVSLVGFPASEPSIFLVFLFLGIMPAGYIQDRWDAHLSLAMYSGRSVEAMFFMDNKDSLCVPDKAKKDLQKYKDNPNMSFIYLDSWSYSTINTPVYASEWAYNIIFKKYCSCIKDKESAGIIITHFPMTDAEEEETKIYCDEIVNKKKTK
jgi:hypothetical protein